MCSIKGRGRHSKAQKRGDKPNLELNDTWNSRKAAR